MPEKIATEEEEEDEKELEEEEQESSSGKGESNEDYGFDKRAKEFIQIMKRIWKVEKKVMVISECEYKINFYINLGNIRSRP